MRESLAHLKKKSDDEEEDLKVRSRAWETLTEEGRKKNNNGFSFGFDIDE